MAQTTQGRQSAVEVSDWLRLKAQEMSVPATVYSDFAKEDRQFLTIPVHIGGDLDAYSFAGVLQDLEDAYNNQDPRPDWLLILRPAAAPRP